MTLLADISLNDAAAHSPGEVPRSLSLSERLSLIALIDEGMRLGASHSPIVADLFSNLWELVGATIAGSRLRHMRPEGSQNGFRLFEVNAESGENLGRLNMLYLKKPIPCYYLAYVEVAPLFRKQGLGHRILEHFRDFLIEKSALGILDNIIPEGDPTYHIYFKHCWEPVESLLGEGFPGIHENYMVFVPPKFQNRDLKEPLLKLIYHLKRKRAVIDMKDNEVMVTRTIAEFRELYTALVNYFDPEIKTGKSTPLMRFMFTRFFTKFIAFRRRIGDLLGYTGGESMEQISPDPVISSLPCHSYAPKGLTGAVVSMEGNQQLTKELPSALTANPARFIEALPNYRRPALMTWLREKELGPCHVLTLGDLLDLGFDPTRLKEISLRDRHFIFERMQAKQSTEIKKKKRTLEHLSPLLPGVKIRGASLKANPPLALIRDRGNAYVLRRKVPGIHWEEALEQLHLSPHLKEMNRALHLDRMILRTVDEAREQISTISGFDGHDIDSFAWFVSWDLGDNRPDLTVDFSGPFLRTLWIA